MYRNVTKANIVAAEGIESIDCMCIISVSKTQKSKQLAKMREMSGRSGEKNHGWKERTEMQLLRQIIWRKNRHV